MVLGLSDASTERDASPQKVSPPQPYLYAAFFGDRPLAAPVAHSLAGLSKVVIGRGNEAESVEVEERGQRQLVLRLPDPRISGAHAGLVLIDGRWVLEDLGSLNGTFVNGASEKRIALFDRDVVTVGHAAFVYCDAVKVPQEAAEGEAQRATASSLGLATLNPTLQLEFARLAAAARSRAGMPILLYGSTGVGKEVAAKAVHAWSGRRGRFVAINCAAISESLAESELFGHRKGAFSGAGEERPGLVRSASGGTLFLDEIGDLPLGLQGKLLRVIQEREVLPVGETRPQPVDLLVVAATHRDLDKMVEAGRFRQDLLARLAGYVLTLPPLAERLEDLGLLIGSILGRLASNSAEKVCFRPAAVRALFGYKWPSNIRELEKCLMRALTRAQDAKIELEHLPDALRASPASPTSARAAQDGAEAALAPHELRQREELDNLLRKHDGKIARVAAVLEKHRMQVQRLVKRYGLQPERYRK